MYAGELATIAREGQPLVILVVVDNALSLIRLKQLRHEVPIHGTEFDRVDYRQLASAHGLRYRLIDSQRSIKAVLDDAIGFDGTILVEARVNREEYNHFL
jgi:thiamine pyrophosphate-dependent acetolactate synthase large subunit-like protein